MKVNVPSCCKNNFFKGKEKRVRKKDRWKEKENHSNNMTD